MTVSSLRQVAATSTLTSHHCEILLRSLADRMTGITDVPGTGLLPAAVGETSTRVPCEAVLAVVEVVSPSTVSIDRAVKPVMYVEAGVPVCWRVELQGTPKIVACYLSRGRYVTGPRSWREPRAASPGPSWSN
jgi:hypothetical protein